MAAAATAAGILTAAAVLPAQYALRRSVDGRPDATIDLRTAEGASIVHGQWRYADAAIDRTTFNRPGPDRKPSGLPVETHDLTAKPNTPAFERMSWTAIEANSLEDRRGTGRLSFAWYRFDFRVPERVGRVATAGATIVFEIVVDDYAEVWVDGRLPRTIGQSGGALVKGWNAPNRVVLTDDARPNQTIQVAVFAANAPLSDPPPNFLWIRSAALDVYAPGTTPPGEPLKVIRADAALDAIVPPGARVEKLAGGFLFTEGPVWVPDGYLLFSDPNANTIYRWSDADGLSVFRPKSGYSGTNIGEYRQPGSNGLAVDPDGRLTINEHGNRRVTRLEKNGTLTVLADRFEGRRLNSPNDLVYAADGRLYFTDPPFGLPRVFDDPRKETPFSGVYLWSAAAGLRLVARELTGPNGIALSPDERSLYVGNWDDAKKVVMRYPVAADGTLGPGTVFCDLTSAPGEDAIDGVKVDKAGHVYVSGPGGLWIFSPSGRHLGTVQAPEHVHNFAWGGADGSVLYLTARSGLYRVRLAASGPVARSMTLQ